MNKSFVNICRGMYIPTCFLMIVYCLLYQYIANYPYVFIIKLILLLSFVFQTIINLFIRVQSYSDDISNNHFIKRMYLQSRQIITWMFNCYFIVYLIFFLDKKSILYNYVVLLLFGLFVGYEIAVTAFRYKKK